MLKKLKYVACVLAMSPALLMAQNESSGQTITLDSNLADLDFASLISSLGAMIAPAIIGVLGLGATVWAAGWIWRKVRSTAG